MTDRCDVCRAPECKCRQALVFGAAVLGLIVLLVARLLLEIPR